MKAFFDIVEEVEGEEVKTQTMEFEIAETQRVEQIKLPNTALKFKSVVQKQLTGPPVEHTVTIDKVTYTLRLSGVAEKKAMYRVISKRKMMG